MFVRTLERNVRRLTGLSVAAVALVAAGPALAQDAAPAAVAAAPAAASPDAMTNLIRLLVAKGTLSQADGDALLQQAQTEAAAARAAMAPPAPPPPPEGAVRVARVPEAVRAQIRDEIRGEIMAQAASEGWVTKDQAAPEWTKRLRLYGDVRVRTQADLYSRSNSTQIIDFSAMTLAGLPVDLSNRAAYRFVNATDDRWNRQRLRLRVGVDAKVNDWISASVMLATGDNNSPISENVSLGGGFAKREIWLDKAFITANPTKWATFYAGRMNNPFNSSMMLFDEDLRFDGLAGRLHYDGVFGDNSTIALTGGAFPLDFGSGDYPDAATNKQRYPTRWLFSGELKAAAEFGEGIEAEASVGYHSFENVQGKLSAPCNLDFGGYCSTDGSAAQFLRRGNTLFTIRNLVASNIDPNGSLQLFGLKFDYNVLDIEASVRVPVMDDIGVRLEGTYIKNLGFRRRDICAGQLDNDQAFLLEPVNNYGSDGNADRHVCTATNPTSFIGGDTGYMGSLMLGHRSVLKAHQWQVWGEYRYLESDAVLDALVDSDFHLGGTNAKGYVLGGLYGIADNFSIGARWLSGNQISGEPLSIDVLQIDLTARF